MEKITFVIPCYRSALTLPSVVAELQALMRRQNDCTYQIILINDGSPDQLWTVIRKLAAADQHILGINLSRNFGQAKARLAALPYINGDITVYLDDDGQHPADQAFLLINKIRHGYDLVFADFSAKKHDPLHRLGSRINGFLLELTRAKPRSICLSSFFAISTLCVEHLREYHSPFPSFTSYIMQFTDKVANVQLRHRPRLAGSSGYTLDKLLNQWLTGFTNFSLVPLRLASMLGGISAGSGFIYALYLIIRKLCGIKLLSGYTSLMAALLIIGGLILLMLGLLGEYVGRIYMTVSDMPRYVIREIIKNE